MRQVIRADGIPFLVAMATSEHLVMQNEALVSLTLISATVLGKIFFLPENPDFTLHPMIVVSSVRLPIKSNRFKTHWLQVVSEQSELTEAIT